MLSHLLLLLYLSLPVLSNTEIVNFHVLELYNKEISLTRNWPKLNYINNEHQWAMPPAPLGTPMMEVCASQSTTNYACPHELWLALDLTNEWSTYSSFTLRLSWPASHPAEFSLDIFDPQSLSTHFKLQPDWEHQGSYSPSSTTQTRLRYARIRLVDTGVLTPPPKSHVAFTKKSIPTPVPFILILEPLYFGVLPPTVVPVVGYIIFVCILSWMIVPTILRRVEAIAVEAKRELAVDGKHE